MPISRAWLPLLLLGGCNSGGGNGTDGGHLADAPKHDSATPDAASVIDAPKTIDAAPEHLGSGFPLLSVEGGIAYAAAMTLGDNLTYQLDVDTGSTTLGVAGGTCSNCGVTPAYTPGLTAVDQNKSSTSTYADGTTWTGENFSDLVKVAGDDLDVTMRFAAMTSQTSFLLGGTQGIIGFGGPEIAVDGTDSYIAKRAAIGLSDDFAFQFCPDAGLLTFGGFDAESVAAPPQFTPLRAISNQQPFYEVTISQSKIGGTSIGLTGAAVADTGTSLMIVSPQVESATINAVQGVPAFATLFPGQTLAENSCLDPGTHSRAEIDAALPPMTVTLPGVGGAASFTLSAPASQSYLFPVQGGYCFGMASVQGVPTILGVAFLHDYVSVFERQAGKLGFATQVGCGLPAFAPHVAGAPVSTQPPHWYFRGRRT